MLGPLLKYYFDHKPCCLTPLLKFCPQLILLLKLYKKTNRTTTVLLFYPVNLRIHSITFNIAVQCLQRYGNNLFWRCKCHPWGMTERLEVSVWFVYWTKMWFGIFVHFGCLCSMSNVSNVIMSVHLRVPV